MKRETHEPEQHELEAAGYTEPDIRMPGDGEWEWVLWASMVLSAVGLAYCVIKLIPILGGVLSWQ